MQVIILGSGSPLVTPDRAGPSTLVRIGKTDLLFDCGRAVLMRGAAVGMTARSDCALRDAYAQ
jgi:ribonuclease Z